MCLIRTSHQMPPRRRAFRCNDFGLDTTTIPRDAKRQAEPPSRQGTHSRQNHFRFNPSRRLVEPHTLFAASNLQPRLNVLPRRDFPAHAPLPGVAALPSSCPCRGCSRKNIIFPLLSRRDILSITPHKRRRSAMWGWMTVPTPSRGAGVGIARREREALEKKRCLENCYCRPCAIMYIST